MDFQQLSYRYRNQYNQDDSPYIPSAPSWSEHVHQANTHPNSVNPQHSGATPIEPEFINNSFHNIPVQLDTYIRSLTDLPSQIITAITHTPQMIDKWRRYRK